MNNRYRVVEVSSLLYGKSEPLVTHRIEYQLSMHDDKEQRWHTYYDWSYGGHSLTKEQLIEWCKELNHNPQTKTRVIYP